MQKDHENEDASHFVAVNLDRQEYIDSRNLDTTEHAITIFASDVLVYLLQGGEVRDEDDARSRNEYSNLGQWAADPVITVSDDESPDVYQKVRSGAEYEEISGEIADEVATLFDRALDS
jgi:hypothetical protein